MVEVFVAATLLVAIAELGDKTQMLSLLLATRFPARRVFAGVLLAVLVLQAIAAGAGRIAGEVVPRGLLAILTSGMFIVVGLWVFRDATRTEENPGEVLSATSRLGPVLAVAAAFFLAELGDKTQVLTFTISADPGAAMRALSGIGITLSEPTGTGAFVAVWLGSSLGMMLVNGVAILVGSAVASRFPRRIVGMVSGALFVLFGVAASVAYLLNS